MSAARCRWLIRCAFIRYKSNAIVHDVQDEIVFWHVRTNTQPLPTQLSELLCIYLRCAMLLLSVFSIISPMQRVKEKTACTQKKNFAMNITDGWTFSSNVRVCVCVCPMYFASNPLTYAIVHELMPYQLLFNL